MIRLKNLEVYHSFCYTTEENIEVQLSSFPDSKKTGTTYEEVIDEIEKILETSDITATDLQDEI